MSAAQHCASRRQTSIDAEPESHLLNISPRNPPSDTLSLQEIPLFP